MGAYVNILEAVFGLWMMILGIVMLAVGDLDDEVPVCAPQYTQPGYPMPSQPTATPNINITNVQAPQHQPRPHPIQVGGPAYGQPAYGYGQPRQPMPQVSGPPNVMAQPRTMYY